MSRSKSKTMLQIAEDAVGHRSHQMLQQSLRPKHRLALAKNVDEVPSKRRGCASLDDSIMFSPDKGAQDEDFSSTRSDAAVAGSEGAIRATSNAALDPLKSAYAVAMQDIRKGFSAVCGLVSSAVTEVTANPNSSLDNTPSELKKHLSTRRFWVECEVLNARFPHPSVVEQLTSDAEIKTPDEQAKERAQMHAKRVRRFQFQIVLRLAFYKVLCEKGWLDASSRLGFCKLLTEEIVQLVKVLATGEKYDYGWRFLENDIQYRCGDSEPVRQLITDVCDEMLIPLPDYGDKMGRKSPIKFPGSLPPSGSSSPLVPKAIQSLRPHGTISARRTASQTHLKPMDTKRSFATSQNSFLSHHRFARQRSTVDFGASQPRSKPPPLLTQKSAPLIGLRKDEPVERVKRALTFGREKVPFTGSLSVGLSNDPVFSPKRLGEPGTAASSKTTPWKERFGSLGQKSPGAGAMKLLTEQSPFKRLSTKQMSVLVEEDQPGPPRVVREESHRRQLQF